MKLAFENHGRVFFSSLIFFVFAVLNSQFLVLNRIIFLREMKEEMIGPERNMMCMWMELDVDEFRGILHCHLCLILALHWESSCEQPGHTSSLPHILSSCIRQNSSRSVCECWTHHISCLHPCVQIYTCLLESGKFQGNVVFVWLIKGSECLCRCVLYESFVTILCPNW